MPADLHDQRGAALLIVILLAVILGALAAGVIAVTITETMISSTHRSSQEASYAAEAALDRAIHDLATVTDWSPVVLPPPGNLTSTFMDGQISPLAPDGRRLDIVRLAAERQRDSDTRDGGLTTLADRPQWRLYAQGPLDRLTEGSPAPPAYLFVWVADDAEGDEDPGRDANGQLLVHAEAFGVAGARRAVEAAIRRTAPGVVQVLTRRAVRQ